MPRSGKGGKRQGAPGKKYPNRTDIANGPKKVPLEGAKLPYGRAGALDSAQSATPSLSPQLPPAAPTGAPTMAPPAAPGPPPVGLFEPTQNPDEPITNGIDSGLGAGSEALGMPQGNDLSDLLPYLPNFEVVAALPNASQSTRNFVRKLRAQVPYGGAQ